MNIYNNLINNLETLELFRFKENIDTYLDMIAGGEKTALDALCELTESEMFNLIAKRYEKLSTIITTNSPFSKWSDIFQEPVLTNALLDRLLHHRSVININGPSYRLKDQMQYMIEEN